MKKHVLKHKQSYTKEENKAACHTRYINNRSSHKKKSLDYYYANREQINLKRKLKRLNIKKINEIIKKNLLEANE